MKVSKKKILSIITYYSLFSIALIMAGLTILYVVNRAIPTWAKVIYVIWACGVIGVLVYDIVCTSMRRMKFVSGLIVYSLSMASVIVTAILYLTQNAGLKLGLTSAFMPMFIGVASLVISTSIYMIATYIVGESVAEHSSALKSINKTAQQ